MFSFGIEPSITSTNGASSSSRAAWRNGSRNSSPASVGDSTLLCRWTLGMPGIAPSSTSSTPGWPAAVIDTESPSQLIPSEIHRMWTSSTAGALGSVATSQPSICDQRVVFVARKRRSARLLFELRALRHEGEGELERRRHHLAQVADLQLHPRHLASGGVSARDADDGVGD